MMWKWLHVLSFGPRNSVSVLSDASTFVELGVRPRGRAQVAKDLAIDQQRGHTKLIDFALWILSNSKSNEVISSASIWKLCEWPVGSSRTRMRRSFMQTDQ